LPAGPRGPTKRPVENVSITLLVVLGLMSCVMLFALAVTAYAVRVERKHFADRGIDPEAPRIRAGSSSSDVHVLVGFPKENSPTELVGAIGGLMDVSGLRGVAADLTAALPGASHAHVSCAHFHDIAPFELPGEGVALYLRVRSRKPVALPEGNVDRALVAALLARLAEVEEASLVEAKARMVKPSTDPASARWTTLD
jgi:hypothetical protein